MVFGGDMDMPLWGSKGEASVAYLEKLKRGPMGVHVF